MAGRYRSQKSEPAIFYLPAPGPMSLRQKLTLGSVSLSGILETEPRRQDRRREFPWALEPGRAGVKILVPQLINYVIGQHSLKGVYKIRTIKLLGGGNEMMHIKALCSIWHTVNVLSTLAIQFCYSCDPRGREVVIMAQCLEQARDSLVFKVFSSPFKWSQLECRKHQKGKHFKPTFSQQVTF